MDYYRRRLHAKEAIVTWNEQHPDEREAWPVFVYKLEKRFYITPKLADELRLEIEKIAEALQ